MSACESIPVLYIRSKNNFDVGLAIGRTFQHFITSYISSKTGKLVQSFYESPQGKEVYDSALAAAEKYFPHIVDEIRGVAQGCGLPFQTLFLNNMVSDILILHTFKGVSEAVSPNDEETEVAGCTDVLVNTETLRLIGHNEDWDDDVDDTSFLVDVEVNRHSDGVKQQDHGSGNVRENLPHRNERYLAFLFPGNLVGNASFVNRQFAFTINSMVPAGCNKGAVPVDILLRALAGCETIEECMEVMKNDPVGCSYGINVNIASRDTKEMWSLEVYPKNGETVVDLEHIPYQSKQEKPLQYVHTNHYKHMENPQELPVTRGSMAREQTASSMPTPELIQDVCNILGDQSSQVEPIYKTTGSSLFHKHVKTVATTVFDMNERMLHVYLRNPKHAQKPNLSLPFVN